MPLRWIPACAGMTIAVLIDSLSKGLRLMFWVVNAITLLRVPLAFAFFYAAMPLRVVIVILAGLSDALDGYLARKYGASSTLGGILDAVSDKFFVISVLVILAVEQQILWWQILMVLTRSIAFFLFAIYLWLKGALDVKKMESMPWGKLATTAQFVFLTILAAGVPPSALFYLFFIVLGVASLLEQLRKYKTL